MQNEVELGVPGSSLGPWGSLSTNAHLGGHREGHQGNGPGGLVC